MFFLVIGVVKRTWKIISRVLLTLGLLVYILVALVNYSIVQSVAGAVAGNYFSREWGGELRIGSLHAMPFDHVILDHVLWVSPTNDTLFNGEKVDVSFHHFPFDGKGLDFDQVKLKNCYYHFATRGGSDINLKFLIDYYKARRKPKEEQTEHEPFSVKVKTLILDNVHYKMDLPDHRNKIYPYGVQIPHMEFFEIKTKMKNVLVVEDDVTCRIVRFSTRERSGFEVKEMEGDVHVNRYEIVAKNFRIITNQSQLVLDAELRYDTWKGIAGYVSTVQHNALLKTGMRVKMSDVAYWAPVLWGIDATVEAEGTATGTIDSLVTDMMVRWGDESSLVVAGTVRGLPNIDTTTFDVAIEHLRTNANDLSPVLGLMKLNNRFQKMIADLGTLNLSADLRGGLQEQATVNMLANCKLGQLRTDATLKRKPDGYSFAAELGSEGLGLALLNTEWITRSGFELSVNGKLPIDRQNKVSGESLELNLDGHLTNTVVKGRHLSATNISGEYRHRTLTATIEGNDSLAYLTALLTAKFVDSVNSIEAELDIDNLDIGLLPQPLATTMTARLTGNTLEEMSGKLTAQMTQYGELKVSNIDLTIDADKRGKDIKLKSDIANASISGQFDYSDLPVMARYFAQLYMPERFAPKEIMEDSVANILANKTISCQVRWMDDGRKLKKMVDNVTIAPGTRLDGSYNFGEQMKIVVLSDSIGIGGINLKDVRVNGRSIGDHYVLQMETEELRAGKMELIEDAKLTLSSNRDRTTARLNWGDMESSTRGDLLLSLRDNKIRVLEPLFYVGDVAWRMEADGLELTDEKRMGIVGERIGFVSQGQQIEAKLSLKGDADDRVEMNFAHFSLELLNEVLLQEKMLELGGEINGNFELEGLNETPYFNANLQIDSCVVNRREMGTVELKSNWNKELGLLQLELANKQIDANGWIDLSSEQTADSKQQGAGNRLNIDARFRDFELALAQPLVASFSSCLEGQISGNVSVTGTTAKPIILGDAKVDEGRIKLDMTNVTYSISDSLRLKDNIIYLKNFAIRDPEGNIALANGEIKLSTTEDISIDLGVSTENLMLLDQRNSEQFNGKIYAAAEGRVHGPVNHLEIAVRANTNRGCELMVPISYQQQVKSQNFITFVNGEQEEEKETTMEDKKWNMDLSLDLTITPNLKLELPMDFKEVGLNVVATGAGEMHLSLSGNDKPQVLGNYVISSGQMKVGMFSVYEKRFSIENGSSINFQGSLPESRFDMQAVYSQRVNLSTLTGSLSSVDNTQKYLQVENVISVSGSLQDPTINFDLRLPNADQSVEEEVFAYIDRNSELDMLNQTLSLLISGSFYNVNSENSTTGGADALGAVTNFFGNSLTDMVQFVDVNIDYKSATEVTNQQLDVNISKDWGRWYLESTLGYGGESRELESNTANGAVIDALIGYRLSPMFHLFAYNRTNTNDYTRIDLPYKQGAGLKLTKDFDRWSDLFRRKNKKKKK